MPNETWQADFTHYRLADQAGTDIETLTWLDDCSRYALHVTCWERVTGPIVLDTFRRTVAVHGVPASTLTDNGMVFTTRLSGGRGGRNALEHELRRLHITQKNSAPNHPTTCGKVERFQQTMKNWLRAQPDQPATLTQLQTLIDRFVHAHNHQRPHRSPPRHPRRDLHHPAQGPAGPQPRRRHPHPRPPRPHRSIRRRHPPPGRAPAPHRRRTNPHRNPRDHAGQRPRRPDRQRRNRRTPPRPDHRPQPRLPTHRPPTRPTTTMTPNPVVGSGSFRCPETSHRRDDRI
ncbi:DDE-type integrase/transposase/recombinase [Streptomyces yerevanensis]|uniref:DDE-type integrase/transposase/recombinase n=1 Tax=Streptomyces yerevanensis TaxID=66378 RepID=UPI0009978970